MFQHFVSFNLIAIVLLFAHLIYAGSKYSRNYIFIDKPFSRSPFFFCFQFLVNNLHTYDGIKTHDIINGDIFFEIIEPEELEYTYRLKPAKDFGGTFTQDIFKQRKRNLLVFAEPREACVPLENPSRTP